MLVLDYNELEMFEEEYGFILDDFENMRRGVSSFIHKGVEYEVLFEKELLSSTATVFSLGKSYIEFTSFDDFTIPRNLDPKNLIVTDWGYVYSEFDRDVTDYFLTLDFEAFIF